jgi:hypothetical protein
MILYKQSPTYYKAAIKEYLDSGWFKTTLTRVFTEVGIFYDSNKAFEDFVITHKTDLINYLYFVIDDALSNEAFTIAEETKPGSGVYITLNNSHNCWENLIDNLLNVFDDWVPFVELITDIQAGIPVNKANYSISKNYFSKLKSFEVGFADFFVVFIVMPILLDYSSREVGQDIKSWRNFIDTDILNDNAFADSSSDDDEDDLE